MKWTMPLLIFLLTGCIRNIDKSSFAIDLHNSDHDRVQELCQELGDIGYLQEHFFLLKKETDLFLGLIENYESPADIEEIRTTEQDLNNRISRIKSLINAEYTVAKFDYEVRWEVSEDDFKKLVGNYLPYGFRVLEVKKLGASFWGVDAPQLIEQLRVEPQKKGFRAAFRAKGSALEVCQLQQTRLLLVEVRYRHLLHERKRVFNLIHRTDYE